MSFNIVYKFQVVGEGISSRIVQDFEAAETVREQLQEEGLKPLDLEIIQLAVCEPIKCQEVQPLCPQTTPS